MNTPYKQRKKIVDNLYNKILKQADDIEKVYKTLEYLQNELESKNTNLKKFLDNVDSKKTEINSNHDYLNKQLNVIESILKTDFKDFKEKFTQKKKYFDEVLNELKKYHDESKLSSDKINKYDELSNQSLESINNIKKEINEYYNQKFIPLKNRMESEDGGLQDIINISTEQLDEIKNVKQKVETLNDEFFIPSRNKLTSLLIDSEEKTSKIDEYLKRGESAYQDIADYLDYSKNASLSNKLGKRSKEIKTKAFWWQIGLIGCLIIISLLTVYYLYQINKSEQLLFLDIIRITFILLVGFLTYFCFTNYIFERYLEE